MYRCFFKRMLDIVLSLLAIIVLALPMFIIGIIVKCDSKGPAIFKTERIGKNGKPFKFYKFRSMTTDAPKDVAPRLLHESETYITKVGAFLRKTSLDELPQLFCIFKGDMSIIGPRPAGMSETDLFEAREKYGANAVRPGLTGLAQVNGRDILASHVERKAWYDGEYVKKITFWRDLKIVFKTVGVVFAEADIVEGDAVETAEEASEVAEVAATEQKSVAKETLEEVAATEENEESAIKASVV
ncbi:MAG: sugar transferase [Clostridia bacterium]|nr:sugar transferase [Clostridia bacterium]